MGMLKVNETPKETQNKTIALLRENAPVQLQFALTFIEKHFDSADDSRRKDAHKLWAKLIDKAIPNTSVIQHEHNGAIDESFAKKLSQMFDGKDITQMTEVAIETVKKEKESEDATERVFATTDAETIHNSFREFLGSK